MESFWPIKLSHLWNKKSKLSRYWESIQLTLNIESLWHKYSPITRNPGSNFSSASDSTFLVKMTPFLLSVYAPRIKSKIYITHIISFVLCWKNECPRINALSSLYSGPLPLTALRGKETNCRSFSEIKKMRIRKRFSNSRLKRKSDWFSVAFSGIPILKGILKRFKYMPISKENKKK